MIHDPKKNGKTVPLPKIKRIVNYVATCNTYFLEIDSLFGMLAATWMRRVWPVGIRSIYLRINPSTVAGWHDVKLTWERWVHSNGDGVVAHDCDNGRRRESNELFQRPEYCIGRSVMKDIYAKCMGRKNR